MARTFDTPPERLQGYKPTPLGRGGPKTSASTSTPAARPKTIGRGANASTFRRNPKQRDMPRWLERGR